MNNLRIVHSPLTDTIYLARFGKDSHTALEKREAEPEVIAAVIEHMMHDTEKGSKKKVRLGPYLYEIQVKRIPEQIERRG